MAKICTFSKKILNFKKKILETVYICNNHLHISIFFASCKLFWKSTVPFSNEGFNKSASAKRRLISLALQRVRKIEGQTPHFPVHFNIYASFPFFASSKLQLNLHLRQVTISLKTATCSPKIFTIASRVCPHRIPTESQKQERMSNIKTFF